MNRRTLKIEKLLCSSPSRKSALSLRWFRKGAVLPNVPSFLFLVPGNIRMNPRSGFWCPGISECALVPVFGTGEHPPKPPFGNHPFANPRDLSVGRMPDKGCHASVFRKKKSCSEELRLAKIRTYWIGANPEKISLVNFRGPH